MSIDRMPWLRLYTEIIDDEKIRLLAFEDRWHYVALLCCKNAGVLDAGDTQAMLARKVAVKLGLQIREVEAMAMRLAEVGLIDPDTFQPKGWGDRQFQSDSSTARVKAYRQRVKRNGNVAVTAQDTDTDTDTEEDQKQASVGIKNSPPSATAAGRACLAMRQAGCTTTNPSHPDLLAALREGVTPEALADTAREGIELGKPKPFSWAIATARGRHEEGAKPTNGASHANSTPRIRVGLADRHPRPSRNDDAITGQAVRVHR